MTIVDLLNYIEKAKIEVYLEYKSNYRGQIIKTLDSCKYDFDVDPVDYIKTLNIVDISTKANEYGDSFLEIILTEYAPKNDN